MRAGWRPQRGPAPCHSPQEACPAAFRTEPPPAACFVFLSPALNARADATPRSPGSGGDLPSSSGRGEAGLTGDWGRMASRCLRHLRRPLSSLLQFPQHLAMLVPRQTYHPYHPTEDKPQEGHVVGGTGEAGRQGGPGSGRCQSPRITR